MLGCHKAQLHSFYWLMNFVASQFCKHLSLMRVSGSVIGVFHIQFPPLWLNLFHIYQLILTFIVMCKISLLCSVMCGGIVGLLNPWLRSPEPTDSYERTSLLDPQSDRAIESSCQHGTRPEEAIVHQCLQETEHYGPVEEAHWQICMYCAER